MRLLTAALLALAFAALPADAATRAFPIAGFVKLRVEGPYTVQVRTGAKASVNARGPQSRIDRLTVESRGDTLVISTEKSWNWRQLGWSAKDTVTVDVTVPMLQAAELTGPGNVSVDKVRGSDFTARLTGSGDLSIARLDTTRLRAIVNGSGDLNIAGRAGRANAIVQGSGDLRAEGLTVGLLDASVLGSGDIRVGATRVAKARVTGSGDISIAGRPSCTQIRAGPGSIRCGG